MKETSDSHFEDCNRLIGNIDNLRDMVISYKGTKDKDKLKGMDKVLRRLILEIYTSWI